MIKLPEHAASLRILHNEHKDYYIKVEDFINTAYKDEDGWLSKEDKQKCIDTNELWVIQWYPDSPVGFYTVLGSSLEIVLEFANRP